MKKLLSVLLITAIGTCAFTACNEDIAEGAVPEEVAQIVDEATSTEPSGTSYELTADQTNLFAAAMEHFVGVNYEPVIYLGIPEENPLGSSFLCKATAVVPDATPFWAIVTVQDVGESVTIENIQVIDYAGSSNSDTAVLVSNQGEPLMGGWQDAANEDLTEDVTAEGVTPVVILARQVVSGMNYCCLTRNDTDDGWNLTYVYQNLQGGAEVTNTAALNI